ncbi:MAG: YfhO family protein [Bacteroidetes bacterium]|jgi:hypothetical protein|nr:YfhO family protein [Bacteroidota bacterium]
MKLKTYLQYITAITLFAVFSVVQFKPLFHGKVIDQSDITQHKGMSKELSDFRKTEHREALWTNSMFGGMPAFQISTLYPGNQLDLVEKALHLFMPPLAGCMFMFFFGFFILLLCLGVDPWVAIAGSLAFGFSSYFYIILDVGHNSKANAMTYLAPALGGIILLMRGKYYLGFALTALFLALELNANHLQVSYYGFLLFCLVFMGYFVRAFKEKTFRPYFTGLAVFLAAFLVSILPNSGSLLCTYEYGKYSSRGKTELTIDPSGASNKEVLTSGLDKDYALQYSYGISESFTFLVPDFKGGGSGDRIASHKKALDQVDPEMKQLVGQFGSYYGPQEYSAGPSYVGVIVMLLAFLSLLIVDHTIKWPLLIATLFSVMLAWGKYFEPLSAFFLDYFPGYNKFRAVSIINIIAELCIPLLAVLALDKIIKTKGSIQSKIPFLKTQTDLKRSLLLSVLVIGGFCFLCFVLPGSVNEFTQDGEEAQIAGSFKNAGYPPADVQQLLPSFMDNLVRARTSVFTSDALRSLIFVLLAAALLFLFIKGKIKHSILVLGVCIAVTADLWPVAKRYLNEKSFVPKTQFDAIPMSKADEEILRDKDPDYRVLNIAASPFQDAVTSYYHKSIGGYHGAKLKKYDELIRFHLFREIDYFRKNGSVAWPDDSLRKTLLNSLPVLNMLNTKYIICPTTQEPLVLRNTESNGNAWFVEKVEGVATADEEMMALKNTDTKSTCLLRKKNRKDLKSTYTAAGNIQLISYKPDQLVYETSTSENQFAVFSEIFYPEGWNASIDGKEKTYYCVNYLLRGMEIPAGKHKVEFRFEPETYHMGNRLAYAGSGVLIGLVLAALYMAKRGNGRENS